MTTDPTPQDTLPEPAPPKPGKQALSLLAKGGLLAAAAAAVVAAIAIGIPEVNDGAYASVVKHRQLEQPFPRKIVLVGGSNLSFGVDSTQIKRVTGCDVANMGMNGYLGVRYMLNEVKPHLKPSDIVVVALEYDNYFKSIDGTAADQFVVLKANPQVFEYLTWPQRLRILETLPNAAQQKVLRLMQEGVDGLQVALTGTGVSKEYEDIVAIESLKGFTKQGDLVAHLGVKWEAEREDGVNMDATPLEPEVFDVLRAFTQEMDARGVKVMISFTPVVRDYYDRYRSHIDGLYTAMADGRSLRVPSRPSDFVFEDSQMFDTVYHLNADGRSARTNKLISDIERQFGAEALCGGQAQLTQNGESRTQ